MNAFLAKNICNCHVESVIIKINNDERDFETEFLHENDNQSKADLMKHNLKKVGIFDQKIIEVAITNVFDQKSVHRRK